MSRQADLQKLITEHSRRLQKLKELQARKGIDTEPHIFVEIEDLEAEIENLQAELSELEGSGEDIRTKPRSVNWWSLIGGLLSVLIIGGCMAAIISFASWYRTDEPTPTGTKITRTATNGPPSATFTPEPPNIPISLTDASSPTSSSISTSTLITTPEPTPTVVPSEQCRVVSASLNLRNGPGTIYDPRYPTKRN
jgi:hypothetical protein